MTTMAAWINPLRCIEIDFPQPNDSCGSDASMLLDYLFAPGSERTTEAFVRRYRDVLGVVEMFPLAPAEPTVLQKLIWPLRHAIGSYCLADYLGCIALAGMVGEMVAILLWEISQYPRGNPPLGEQQQKQLFGSQFEKLGQERRTGVLQAFRLIDDDTRRLLDRLREIRRRYLHLFSQSHDSLEQDARAALDGAARVVAFALGLAIKDGAVGLRPELMAYVESKSRSTATEE